MQYGEQGRIIRKLTDDSGNTFSDEDTMQSMAMSYFKELFMADDNLNASPVVDLFEPCISDEANNKLCEEFSDKEISDALFQIGPLKAPGPVPS